MAWVIADVRRVAPELAPVADADITVFIQYANQQISPVAFANLQDAPGPTPPALSIRDMAGTWLTAHFAALARPDLVRGTATEKRVGPIGVSYSNPYQASSNPLNSTRFGREYLRLVNTSQNRGPALDVL